jgi:hypothetical protein
VKRAAPLALCVGSKLLFDYTAARAPIKKKYKRIGMGIDLSIIRPPQETPVVCQNTHFPNTGLFPIEASRRSASTLTILVRLRRDCQLRLLRIFAQRNLVSGRKMGVSPKYFDASAFQTGRLRSRRIVETESEGVFGGFLEHLRKRRVGEADLGDLFRRTD